MSTGPQLFFIPDPPSAELGDDLFAREHKQWREWNVGLNFLTNLHIGVDESKIFCCAQDPPDVIFQDARFEIKEIMDIGRRRHDEVKAARLQARMTGKPVYSSGSVIDLSPVDAGNFVLKALPALSRYPSDVRSRTDLLFYINLMDHWFADGPMPPAGLFSPYGWRSASAVIASTKSLVFHVSANAPDFLQANVGLVRSRSEPL